MAIDSVHLPSFICLAVLALSGSGCFSPDGILITRTTAPYELPTDRTVLKATKSCSVDITQLREPVTQAHLSVVWTSRVVVDAASRAGISDIRYADLQTFSVLNGVYKRQRLVFYGE
jgi:hypothetical protein